MTSTRFKNSSIPALKPTVQRNDLGGNIFLRTSARVTEIENGTIYYEIANQIDGEKGIDTIINILNSKGYKEEEIRSAFDDFDDLLLLEDRTAILTDLTEYDTSRWARNLNFFGSFSRFGVGRRYLRRYGDLSGKGKLAVEPAGTAALAGAVGPLRQRIAGKRIGIVICGANIDTESYLTLTERGRRHISHMANQPTEDAKMSCS